MPTVETVGGAVDVSALGQTLMHEHVFVVNSEVIANYPHLWDEQAQVAAAVDRLRGLVAAGVSTIVDPTVLGLGRFIPRIQRVAEQVPGLNIVAATGLYTYRDVPISFSLTGPGTLLGGEDPLTELFVRDLRHGIGETGVKAAFLKCAVDEHGLTPGVERVLRAVIAAHHETGAPITVHTSVANQSGRTVQDLLRAEGVDLTRVVLGHVGDTADLDYLKALADEGSYLGMDRFGLPLTVTAEQRIDTVAALCAQGYADRMVLAQDSCSHIDWVPAGLKEQLFPDWRYDYIPETVVPALRERGVTQEQLHLMLVANPARYLTTAR
ncbi:phosphotriesterase-related protein [Crossiella equi]|uniref:Phosphotriesterase-related protein n=1 Tax=Crossiella equi TaxID=130796 RepID=A0ABS5ANH3_9PSEU|nr:phosphotriesterase [Crossiella equi]MBP2478106.1 phosphotriesterase-related protein [Crossiella equi]